jgi:hypothetical protein
MKKALTLLLAILSIAASATQIMWVGADEGMKVHLGNTTLSITDWISTLACTPDNVAGRISIGDLPQAAGYEVGYRECEFDDDIVDFGILLTEEVEPGVWQAVTPLTYADYQPIRLTENTPSDVSVFYELGYWDENLDWEFVPVAVASASLNDLWAAHTYTAGTLAPPTETPWHPTDFYAIPEPNPSILAILGTLFLLKRRKCQSWTT